MANISDEWKEDCLEYRGVVLTGAGAHWCVEWDDLPIDETCYEWPCCEYATSLNIPATGINWKSYESTWEPSE